VKQGAHNLYKAPSDIIEGVGPSQALLVAHNATEERGKVEGIGAFLRAKGGRWRARMARAKKVKAGSEQAAKLGSQRHDGGGFQGEGSSPMVPALPATPS
jgi:hypothetical protein